MTSINHNYTVTITKVKWVKPQKKNFKMIVRMINGIKEDTNKCLNEFHENSNIELNKIKKASKDMKEEFNKEIEILEKVN
jgi:hypothetical protein